ncbi:MAG: BON domain-containing protein, partial [Myxococcota bacterium]
MKRTEKANRNATPLTTTPRARRLALSTVAAFALGSIACDGQSLKRKVVGTQIVSPLTDIYQMLDVQRIQPASTSKRVQGKPTDIDVRAAVARELSLDDAVRVDRLRVEVVQGIVTLEGETDNALARQRAATLAQHIRGVRAVNNLIETDLPEVSDPVLAEMVEFRLNRDRATSGAEVDVDARGGLVVLTGQVESLAQRDIAERIALGTRGVHEVDNRVGIVAGGAPTEDEIATEVASRIRWDATLPSHLIKVKVVGSQVFLSGTVASAAQKQRAFERASVRGVSSIDATTLAIESWSNSDMFRHPADRVVNGDEIAKAIAAATQHHPYLVARTIEVSVKDGVATLDGRVPTVRARAAASELAANTFGVRDVINRLEVDRDLSTPDESLASTLRRALEADSVTEGSTLQVKVERGRATLSGTTRSSSVALRAGEIARSVEGVSSVDNDIEVEFPSPAYASLREHEYLDDVLVPRVAHTHLLPDDYLRDSVEFELY